ncbi:MAG: hypothetical protein B7X65_16065 [Polaromonas sp. 39-63-25]|jgi:hypothetical protein|nr:MAG: hypothetical protein B7Y60_16340 [Polaromonas sp. 35-63-35]OYZ17858.1 MAG: hypothetical protein B7Y28_18030 [Polaromonas sp. 16-63-31]OYZ77256.1 MAG: hypothetical protein B7Y09_17375 [Polaromonas sp. 24-63-21]OZA48188.1 MAG: hypothetical protein B7X88_19405 [Polaromonas sp. 17-63-33]OZA86714.1 MAG: hypothetical protein B7X65_16065 [Polaromonas sp. 39-63-25]
MQYTLSLTTRMMTIAGLCLLLLCVLLFLLGVEIGKKISSPAEGTAPAAVLTVTPPSSAPVGDAPSPSVAKP